jgi:hypothetical protein
MPYAESLGYPLKILARVEPLRDDGERAPTPRAKRVHVGRRLVVGIEHAKRLGSLGCGRENRRDFVPSGGQDPLGFGRSCGGVEAEGDPPPCCVLFLVHHITRGVLLIRAPLMMPSEATWREEFVERRKAEVRGTLLKVSSAKVEFGPAPVLVA